VELPWPLCGKSIATRAPSAGSNRRLKDISYAWANDRAGIQGAAAAIWIVVCLVVGAACANVAYPSGLTPMRRRNGGSALGSWRHRRALSRSDHRLGLEPAVISAAALTALARASPAASHKTVR